MAKKALLINPPVYDVQYWERWSLPHGLLRISSYLKQNDFEVKLIDCLRGDINRRVKSRRMSVVELGTCKEYNLVEFGNKLPDKFRYKSCYGMSINELISHFENVWSDGLLGFGVPDEVWITSIMSYWWESTRDVISLCKKYFPHAKIRVGGVYPTIAPNHAFEKLGLRNPVKVNGDKFSFNDEIQQSNDLIVIGEIPDANNLWLDIDLYSDNEELLPDYTILTTSRGCPRDCEYCAAYILSGKKVRVRDVDSIIDEIRHLYDTGIREFCFYEDNLLMAKKNVMELLERIASDSKLKGIELFTPEGLEIRLIDQELANLMASAGFKRVYLPLESIDYDNLSRFRRDFYSLDHFENAVKCFENAGFNAPQQINTFVLFGLPGEDLQSVYDTSIFAANRTGSVIPMLFAPVPGTPLFDKLQDYIEENEFEFHQLNGKLLPFLEYNRQQMKGKYEITYRDYKKLEAFMFRINQKVLGSTFRFGSQSRVGKAFRHVITSRLRRTTVRNNQLIKHQNVKQNKLITEYHGSLK